MRTDRFTQKAIEAIQEAESLAHTLNHALIEPDQRSRVATFSLFDGLVCEHGRLSG